MTYNDVLSTVTSYVVMKFNRSNLIHSQFTSLYGFRDDYVCESILFVCYLNPVFFFADTASLSIFLLHLLIPSYICCHWCEHL